METRLKSVPVALALLASALTAPAFADDQLNKLNNQVYAGVAVEPTTFNGEATVRPQDAVYMAVKDNIEAKSNGIRNVHAGVRWQPRAEGVFLEAQGRNSTGTLSAVVDLTGAKNPPPPMSFKQDWKRSEALANVGWALSVDGGAMQVTPFLTLGSTSQSQYADFGVDGSQEHRMKSSFVGFGFKHQTSLTPTLALELEAAYERHSLSWDIINLDVFGQPDSAPVSVSIKRADGARLSIGLSQALWKNLRVNYGLRHTRLSASGTADTTPLSFSQGLTSVSLGLGLTF